MLSEGRETQSYTSFFQLHKYLQINFRSILKAKPEKQNKSFHSCWPLAYFRLEIHTDKTKKNRNESFRF